jgi:serine/threonine protein kinase
MKDADMIAREKSRVDAVAMERLQGSPRVIDIYGHCTMTLSAEFIGGNIKMEEATKDMSPREKLSVAIEIARGVDDVHSMARLAHNDLHTDNLLFTPDKRLKLNDFNQGVLFTKDKHKDNKTDEMCQSAASPWMPFLRGPEEQNKEYMKVDKPNGLMPDTGVMPDKVDIYYLGNALFTLLFGREPWIKDGNKVYQNRRKRHGKLILQSIHCY